MNNRFQVERTLDPSENYVVDTWVGDQIGDQFFPEIMCECVSEDSAELICSALNSYFEE